VVSIEKEKEQNNEKESIACFGAVYRLRPLKEAPEWRF
jgi:hypothetical protein